MQDFFHQPYLVLIAKPDEKEMTIQAHHMVAQSLNSDFGVLEKKTWIVKERPLGCFPSMTMFKIGGST